MAAFIMKKTNMISFLMIPMLRKHGMWTFMQLKMMRIKKSLIIMSAVFPDPERFRKFIFIIERAVFYEAAERAW